jgi:predicted regulator of Ras-like GTPase activity (Roadblock/LC7/MglB family)
VNLQDHVASLVGVPGVRSAALVTRDGEFVAGELHDEVTREVISALTSFMGRTANRGLGDAGLGAFDDLSLVATHGRLLVVQADSLYMVLMTDQFVDESMVLLRAKETASQLHTAGRQA